MAQKQGKSSADGGRLDGSNGTAVTTAAIALGAGWGSSTFTVADGSTDQRGQMTITGVTGGGLAQATATITFTFVDGAYAATPWPQIRSTSNNTDIDTGRVKVGTRSTTGWVGTYSVLPVNAKVYIIDWKVVQ